jgi:uncharacterized repeat protein (TIGR02543 family)
MARSKLLTVLLLLVVLTFVFAFSSTALGASLQLQDRYFVTYHANNGTTDTEVDGQYLNSFTAYPADTFDPPAATATYYYVFKEWNTEDDGSGTAYDPGQAFSIPPFDAVIALIPDYDMDLYAIWDTVKIEQRAYTVKYLANYPDDADGIPMLWLVVEDGPYLVGTNVAARTIEGTYVSPTNYTFAGWSLTDDGWVEYYPGEVFAMPAYNLTLYAVWTNKPILNRDDHIAYMQGYPDGTFKPERNMTRAEAVLMFARLLTEQLEPLTTYTSTYTDLGSTWLEARNAIGFMQQEGVLSTAPPYFRPQQNITRAEFADLACGFENLTTGLPSSFSDVPASHPYYDEINYAVARGWLSGYPDGTFRPDNPIKRAEVTSLVNKVLERYCDQTYVDTNTAGIKYYYDMPNPASHWAYYQIMEASNSHDYTKIGIVETWTGLI